MKNMFRRIWHYISFINFFLSVKISKQARLIIFLKVFFFFFWTIFEIFMEKSIWINYFLVELHVALLKKGFLIDVLCQNILWFFLITFSKLPLHCCSWNVLQSFLYFDNSIKCIANWMGNMKGALDKKSPYDLFKKESWSLWSKSLKIAANGFILIKKNFFLSIFPAFKPQILEHYFFL